MATTKKTTTKRATRVPPTAGSRPGRHQEGALIARKTDEVSDEGNADEIIDFVAGAVEIDIDFENDTSLE